MNESEVVRGGPQPASAGRGIIALKKWIRDAGLDPVTAWRWEKRGWIETINIAGRRYLTAEGLAKFQRRAEAGEFAQEHRQPTYSQIQAAIARKQKSEVAA